MTIMQTDLYGIPNCDQVKKARAWLSQHQITAEFHDFKKIKVTQELIEQWLAHIDWQELLNRRGTTWRGLPDTEKQAINNTASAVQCMINFPSIIKRPVLLIRTERTTQLNVGFSDLHYRNLFPSSNTKTP